ncbi:hypothetical protein RSOLAG1IB_08427 [Rhizoctonia solani AG-1 IB]|uniref:Ricin B lectin domain-containing protein n=1 Tax=Thanatephorus cucumeris (strain AG1-IB / isolate 7/3/14) TaxID=1108050 RepID=M5CGI4_THACB|nr:hypothetical protein BN14_10300 [Rhizoctonia solani AG-1 IB]CEL57194.1 hypothetical protein RSOLAG1IB_08427 [Rhizoctonia solani AG-1 IB]
MSRFPTLLTALSMLSAILTPALTLDPGVYTITHTTTDNKTVFLDSEYGHNEEIQLNRPRKGDNGQLWRVNPESNGAVSLENVKHQCALQKGTTAFGVPTIICSGNDVFNLTRVTFGGSNTYYVDLAYSDEPRRMASDCLFTDDPHTLCYNATLTLAKTPLKDGWFTFIAVDQSS